MVVNDRGLFVNRRDVSVTRRAARRPRFRKQGLATVRIEEIVRLRNPGIPALQGRVVRSGSCIAGCPGLFRTPPTHRQQTGAPREIPYPDTAPVRDGFQRLP